MRRKRLGVELRRLREANNVTGDALARELGWSPAKVSRIENARVRPDVGDVMDMLDQLGVGGSKRDEIVAIARDAANVRGWWRDFGPEMSVRQRNWVEIEAGVSSIRDYYYLSVPGLLQTEAYTRVRFEVMQRAGRRGFDVDIAVAARMQRQMVLRQDPPPAYTVVLDETLFLRRMAPPEVLREQFRHLVSLGRGSGLTLRVIPLSASIDVYKPPLTAFSIYQFTDPGDPGVVGVETETRDLFIQDEDEFRYYMLLFDRLAGAALSEDDSLSFVATAADRL